MRLPPSRIAAFLQRPDPEIRAVLLYGPDEGLVRERAEAVARSVCPDLKDPFRVADLTAAVLAADPARLADEAAQLSLTGGRRVVRVRGAGDALAKLFAGFLESTPGEALVVVEAGELPSRSALRRAFEAARSAVAIGCYPDTPRELAAVIRETLAAHRVSASRDAGQFLVEHLGGDRLLTRSELEKLALYAGEGGRVELEDARLSVSDTAALELDDAVMAAAEGDAVRVERVLGRVLQAGGIAGFDNPRIAAPPAPTASADRPSRGRRKHRRSVAHGAPADLLQTGRQFPAPARPVDRGTAAPATRPHRQSRTQHEDHGPPRRDDLPRGHAGGGPGRARTASLSVSPIS